MLPDITITVMTARIALNIQALKLCTSKNFIRDVLIALRKQIQRNELFSLRRLTISNEIANFTQEKYVWESNFDEKEKYAPGGIM